MRAARLSPALVCSAIALCAATAGGAPESTGFLIVSPREQPELVRAKDRYDLLSLNSRAYVALQPGRDGNELTTRPARAGAVQLAGKNGADPKCGDKIALRVDNAFVIYGNASPLSLVTTTDAKTLGDDAYQWRIAGCKAGTPVLTQSRIALVNLKANDALVGCRRPWGPPFCWDEKQAMGVPVADPQKKE